ncbi:MAG: hypothetical protein ACYDCC_14700 [Actinomycetota bacterium]
MGGQTAAAVASRLAAHAAANGLRAPIGLPEIDSRCWVILASGGPSRSGDSLVLDQYGDLWWTRMTGLSSARITRECWPEEAALFEESITSTMETVLGIATTSLN